MPERLKYDSLFLIKDIKNKKSLNISFKIFKILKFSCFLVSRVAFVSIKLTLILKFENQFLIPYKNVINL